MIYKLSPLNPAGQQTSVIRLSDMATIPFDPANTDYQNFKTEINDQTAQLEDADGNLMTAQQAIDYVKTLP